MSTLNLGCDPEEIARLKEEITASSQSFVYNEDEPRDEDFAHFWFIGQHQGREVIFDAVMFTLRFEHSSLVYEEADRRAAQKFPGYQPWDLVENTDGSFALPDNLDEDIEMYKDEVMAEIEEEESIKVQERLTFDEAYEYGVGLEVALNADEINDAVVENFVRTFNAGEFEPDPTRYAFQQEEDEEEL